MFKSGNEKRDELLFSIVNEFEHNVKGWTWQDVANELEFGGKYEETADTCRKAYKRYCNKKPIEISDTEMFEYHGANLNRKTLESMKEIDDVIKSKENITLERKKDGTLISERKVILSETDMKDDRCVLLAHGFDPDKYEVESIKNRLSVWENGSKDGHELQSYQSSLTVKPKSNNNELTKQDVDDLVKNIKPIPNNFALLKHNRKEELALEVDFSDLHVGSLSWHEEVGEDNDYKITFNTIKRQVEQAREIIELYNVNKVYLCFLGDFLQCDNIEGSTTKGTPVDTDSRSKKMVNKGMEIAMYIIENLAIAETEVIWIEGNHSRLVEYTLFRSLPYVYLHAKHIKFDVSPRIRKAFVYGDNLIGLHHGEMKKDQMFSWLQVEYRELWGKAKYAETHSGHIHQESVTEKGGIINRTNPTSKVQDAYEYENGWKSEKASIAYLWSKEDKLKGQFYLR